MADTETPTGDRRRNPAVWCRSAGYTRQRKKFPFLDLRNAITSVAYFLDTDRTERHSLLPALNGEPPSQRGQSWPMSETWGLQDYFACLQTGKSYTYVNAISWLYPQHADGSCARKWDCRGNLSYCHIVSWCWKNEDYRWRKVKCPVFTTETNKDTLS